MTLCKQIQERATYLAALSERDPERQDAFTHASTCEDCASKLKIGQRVVALLDSVPDERPSAEALARASSLILAELDEQKKRRSPVSPIALGGSIAISCAALASWAAPHIDLRPGVLSFLGVLLASLLVGLLPRKSWSIGLWLLASVLLTGATAGGHWHGYHLLCLWVEASVALIPLVVGAYLIAKGHSNGDSSGLFFSQVAAASAFAGQAIMIMTCPNTNLTHLLVAHTGGVILAAAGGALLSARFVQSAQ